MKNRMIQNIRKYVHYICGSCIVLIWLLLLTCVSAEAESNTVSVSVKGKMDYTKAYEALNYTNQLRKQVGEQPLIMDRDLLNAAMLRAAETALVFDHERPDGSMCFTACPQKMHGENIAYGSDSAKSTVMQLWKNSPGHYRNMISSNYRSIGIGCFSYHGVCYWAQCFGSDAADKGNKPADKTTSVHIQLHKNYLNSGCIGISSNLSSTALNIGNTAVINLLFLNPDLNGKTTLLQWNDFRLTSDHPEILSVNSAGQINARKKGTATLSITHPEFPGWAGKIQFTVTDANSRNVIFNANGGYISRAQNAKTQKKIVTCKKKYGTLPAPVRKGYTFTGWYTKKSGGAKITASRVVSIPKGKTQMLYAHWSKVSVKKAAVSKLSSKSCSLTAKWKGVSGARGYEVYLSSTSRFPASNLLKKNLSASKKTCTFKSLIKNKKYYFKVRAYKMDSMGNKIYGKFSSVKSLKVK